MGEKSFWKMRRGKKAEGGERMQEEEGEEAGYLSLLVC
jgi:hypothetical protein